MQLTELQIENCEFLNCQIHASLIQSSRVYDCSFFQVKSDAVVERNTLLGLNLLECDFAELKLVENQSTMLTIDQATRLAPSMDSVRHLRPIEGYEQSFKIAVIGTPLAGKTSIIVNLRKQLRAHGPIRQQVGQMNHSLLHLYGQIAARPIHICTSPGSVLYQHLTLLPMLAQADLIIYVYSMDHKAQKEQLTYFNMVCLPYLHQLKKTWKSIPWVLVLNKMDCYQKVNEAQTATKGLSLAELIKKGMPVIPSVAYQGRGSKELLEALAKQIGA